VPLDFGLSVEYEIPSESIPERRWATMADTIRVGMIGCDTSHCGAFIKLFQEKTPAENTPAFRVVACYPSFSPDVKNSVSRVDDYKKEFAEKWQVKMTASIEEMLKQVDVVLLESVDGRRHLKELRPVAEAGKPVFIDKPFAASLADAKEMVKIIKDTKLPAFSSSSLRYDSKVVQFMAEGDKHGRIVGCDAFGPAHLEPTNPGLFWYGIHGVEILYTIMGRGCKAVQCMSTPDGDLAIGAWKDGRLGSMRGIRKGKADYGAMVLCEKSFEPVRVAGDFYQGLAREVIKFFMTRQAPVPIEETLEICAFMDAALRSDKKEGDEVALDL
jgi:hypothetical protein